MRAVARRNGRARGLGHARREGETVLILGTAQRAAQATARSLSRAGFRVVGAWEGGRLAGRTRYCERLYRIPPASATEAFLAAVREIGERESVRAVVPLSDELQGALLTDPGAAAPAVVLGPSLEEFRRLCDKVGLIETAGSAGLQCPASAVVTHGGARELPPLPAYLKVVTSMYSGRAAGRPVRVHDRVTCEQLLDELTHDGDTVLVQGEITGRQWRYDFVRGREWVHALASVQLADYPYRVGQSTVLQFGAMPPQLAERSLRLLTEAGYHGVGSIQWIEHAGDWFVHDVNLRLPASVAGMIAAGLDMPRLAVEAALGHEPPPQAAALRPVRYVWLEGEMISLRDTLAGARSGRSAAGIAGSLLLAAVSPARRLVPFDLSDPLPTLAAVSAVARVPRSVSPA